MARYVVTPAALSDLREIVEYLREQEPIAALRFLEAAQATFEHASHFPHAYPRFRATEFRWRPLTGAFSKYLVFYLLDDDGRVNVVRVIHGARDLDEELGH